MSERIKVLAVVPSAFCFGLQRISVDLFKRLKSEVSVHFVVTRWNDGEFVHELQLSGLSYSFSWLGMFSRRLDARNLKMSLHALIKLPRLYWDVISLIGNKKPHVLYFANHHELILLLPVLWFVRLPVVCHMHDPSPAIQFQRMTFKLYGGVVDSFIAISNDVKDRLMLLGCPAEKIVVIHNGVEIPEFSHLRAAERTKFGIKDGDFVFGIAGQMTLTKGHTDVLEAFQHVHRFHDSAKLLIGSRKTEPLYSLLVEFIEKNDLKEAVIFTDWLPAMSNFYAAIDVYVLASRHMEGYGLVVAEAMASGVPAIITRSGGAVELIQEDVDGWIVPRQDPESMAEKMIYIVTNHDQYTQVRSRVKQKITDNFSLQMASSRLRDHLIGAAATYGIRK